MDKQTEEVRIQEFDLCGFVCPLSKIKAAEVINTLGIGEMARIILGDAESLKSVAQELKNRGMKPNFERQDENRFVLTVTK